MFVVHTAKLQFEPRGHFAAWLNLLCREAHLSVSGHIHRRSDSVKILVDLREMRQILEADIETGLSHTFSGKGAFD